MASQGQTPEEINQDNVDFQNWMRGFRGKYVGKGKKADWWAQRNEKYRQRTAGQLMQGNPTGNILSGTEAEQKAQLAGLNLGALSTGMGLGQAGQQEQDVLKTLKSRVDQGAADPVTAAIMSQKQAAEAQTRRNLAGTGARGTAMAGAIDAVGRQQSQRIAESLYGQQGKSLEDYSAKLNNLVSRTLRLMYGEKAGAVAPAVLPKEDKGLLGRVLS
jgi:hypothetical protein